MADDSIQNCGWRFEFKCPKTWDSLRETPEPGVRACDHCQQHVYLCRSESEMSRHVREGHCIAAPAGVHTLSPIPVEQRREEPLDVGLFSSWESAAPGIAAKLLQLMLSEAHRAGVEQLRLEATDSRLVVRHLVEGSLREVHWPPLRLREALLRQLQERSGASEDRPGLLQSPFRLYRVLFRRLDRDMEVVLSDLGARPAASGKGRP